MKQLQRDTVCQISDREQRFATVYWFRINSLLTNRENIVCMRGCPHVFSLIIVLPLRRCSVSQSSIALSLTDTFQQHYLLTARRYEHPLAASLNSDGITTGQSPCNNLNSCTLFQHPVTSRGSCDQTLSGFAMIPHMVNKLVLQTLISYCHSYRYRGEQFKSNSNIS